MTIGRFNLHHFASKLRSTNNSSKFRKIVYMLYRHREKIEFFLKFLPLTAQTCRRTTRCRHRCRNFFHLEAISRESYRILDTSDYVPRKNYCARPVFAQQRNQRTEWAETITGRGSDSITRNRQTSSRLSCSALPSSFA